MDTTNSISPGLPHQGDGLNMMMEAGASTEGLGRLQLSGPSYSGNIPSLTTVATEPNVVWLNAKGERFTDEANGFNDFQSVNPILRQPGQICYVLLDDKIVKTMMHEELFRVYPGSLRPTGSPIPELDKDFDLAQKGLKPVEQVDTEKCRGCGICVDLCTVGAYSLETPVTNAERVSPCQTACPAGVNMPAYLGKLQSGKIEEAYAVLRESLPLPAITGRVCPHFCEKECARGESDKSVNINALERFVADAWLKEKAKPLPRKYKKKVAVTGSGPAGLSCAYFLTRMGYPVTVFEAQPVLGGMLRLGIPEYRLPRAILDEQISYIRDMGVEFKTNTIIGKDITLPSLMDKYDAVFFAGGNQSSRKIEIEGDMLRGVLWGLDFLKSVNLGVYQRRLEGKVVVIGGGNVAVDVALTARRMGATEVQIACLEKGDQIPAFKEEFDQASAEGIKINEGWGPKRVIGKNGKVTGVELVHCTSVFDSNKKFNPSYDETINKIIFAETIILAVGQAPDSSLIPPGMKTAKNGMIISDPLTKETSITGVFSGGDINAGTSVVEAIADGHAAAISIDRFLKGENLRQNRKKPGTIEKASLERVPKTTRINSPSKTIDRSTWDFDEIKTGFNHLMASQEVRRCLTCGSKITLDMKNCSMCKLCETNCPFGAIKTTTRKIEPLGKISTDLNEIAEWMGTDPTTLKETVRSYNTACDNGYDPVYNKDRRYLQSLRNPPYYVFKCGTVYLTTTGGIRTNGNLEVLDNRDNAIPGLFASGNDTGGYEGSTYCVLLPGSTFGYAVNSGRIAGENAAEYAASN